MKARRLGGLALAVAAVCCAASPPVGAAAQFPSLDATIAPTVVEPAGRPVASSVDPCVIGASSLQIEVVITDPHGDVLSDWWYHYPDDIFGPGGAWSLALSMTDASGQPVADPWPDLGTYTVQVNCVSTYLPRVVKPYDQLSFEVVDQLPAPTTTTPAVPADAAPAGSPTPAVIAPEASPAVAVEAEPDYTG